VTRSPPKLALPWILEEDWQLWQSVDRDVPSYARWVELFEKNLKLAEASGWPYERVSVRPDPFNDWCKANQRTVGKFDRSLYALELLRKEKGTQPADVPAPEPEVTPAPDTVVSESGAVSVPGEISVEEVPNQPAAATLSSEIVVSAPAP